MVNQRNIAEVMGGTAIPGCRVRTERLARVIAAAEYTWDSREDGRQWLTSPHPELGRRTPLECAATELGARRVEELLDRLFYGIPA